MTYDLHEFLRAMGRLVLDGEKKEKTFVSLSTGRIWTEAGKGLVLFGTALMMTNLVYYLAIRFHHCLAEFDRPQR